MFTHLNETLKNNGFGKFAVFSLHPLQLSAYLDAVWETWRQASASDPAAVPTVAVPGIGTVTLAQTSPDPLPPFSPPLQDALNALDHSFLINGKEMSNELERSARETLQGQLKPATGSNRPLPLWKHLIYAYLIENTRVFEISARVVQETLRDEALGTLSVESHQWVRNTEELFFRDSSSPFLASLTSQLRPDMRAIRRNAYYRMFGLDLNHGTDDNRPYTYHKATVANRDFVRVFQDLLREVWRGYVNATNSTGQNTTDEAQIFELVSRIRDMLNARRSSDPGLRANLSREEFVSVSIMSWFELTVAQGSPIVRDLKAAGVTREEQLTKLGDRVKLAAHSQSRSFFILADQLPGILTLIEEGFFTAANVSALYKPVTAPPSTAIRDSLLQIINHWSIATGTDLKAMPVTPVRG
jgi:hypothetical protein